MIEGAYYKDANLEDCLDILKAEMRKLGIPHLICHVTDPAPSHIAWCSHDDVDWYGFALNIEAWFDLVLLKEQRQQTIYLAFLRKLEDVQVER